MTRKGQGFLYNIDFSHVFEYQGFIKMKIKILFCFHEYGIERVSCKVRLKSLFFLSILSFI